MGGADTYIIAYLAEDQLLHSAQYVQLKCCRSSCIPSFSAPDPNNRGWRSTSVWNNAKDKTPTEITANESRVGIATGKEK
jgi:hypothetical protein